jgi:hypothetical protein
MLDDHDISKLENAFIDDDQTIKADFSITENSLLRGFSTRGFSWFFLWTPVINLRDNQNDWVILCIDRNHNLRVLYEKTDGNLSDENIFKCTKFEGKVGYAVLHNIVYIASKSQETLFRLSIINTGNTVPELRLKPHYVPVPRGQIEFSGDNRLEREGNPNLGMRIPAGSMVQYVYTNVDVDNFESQASAIMSNYSWTAIRHGYIWQRTRLLFPELEDGIKYYRLYRRDNLFSESESLRNLSSVTEVSTTEFIDQFPINEMIQSPLDNEYYISSDNICVSNKKIFVGNVNKKFRFCKNYQKYKRIDITNKSELNRIDTWVKVSIIECFPDGLPCLSNINPSSNSLFCFYDLDRVTRLSCFWDLEHIYINVPYIIGGNRHFIYLALEFESDLESGNLSSSSISNNFMTDLNTYHDIGKIIPVMHNKNSRVMLNWDGRHPNSDISILNNHSDIGNKYVSIRIRKDYIEDKIHIYGFKFINDIPRTYTGRYFRPRITITVSPSLSIPSINIRTEIGRINNYNFRIENIHIGNFKFTYKKRPTIVPELIADYIVYLNDEAIDYVEGNNSAQNEFYCLHITIRETETTLVFTTYRTMQIRTRLTNRVTDSTQELQKHEIVINKNIEANININISHIYDREKKTVKFSIFGQGHPDVINNREGVFSHTFLEQPISILQLCNRDFATIPEVRITLNGNLYTGLYFERDNYIEKNHESDIERQQISDYFNNLPIPGYNVSVSEIQSIYERDQQFLCFSDESGHHFPALNSIRQSGIIEKMHADQNLHDRMLNGLYLFYKNRIEHLVIIDGTNKQEQVLTEPLVYRNIKDSFSFGNNIYFIDDELRDLEGVIYSEKISRERLQNAKKLSYSPSNHSLVIQTDNDLVFLSLRNGQFHIHSFKGTGDRGQGTGDSGQEAGDRGQEAGDRGQEAGDRGVELLPLDNELLLIGDRVLSHNVNNSRVKDSLIATKVFTTNRKIKINRIQVIGTEFPDTPGEISVWGKYFDKEVRIPEYTFKGFNKWHWLSGNNVYTIFQIEARNFENVEHVLIDVVDRE